MVSMMKRQKTNIILGIIGLMGLSVVLMTGCGQTEAVEQMPRPDLVTIDGMTVFGPLERPAVTFPHDLHTQAVRDQGKDCGLCHQNREDGTLYDMFMRTENIDEKTVMDLYHDKCIACHQETADAKRPSGPITCGDCHRREPMYLSTRMPFGMDKSLHYRHLKATDNKCELCHHQYDEAADSLFYVKGAESSCRDCHTAESKDNQPSLRLVVHRSCIGCHRKTITVDATRATGPESCSGCHDAARQAHIEVVKDPPRLDRNQPVFVLLSAPVDELTLSKLPTVPFPHAEHERVMDNCRVCHHQTLKKCNDCHTLAGTEQSGGVTLQQAMHGMSSDHSCVGCHDHEKFTIQCAGCHGLMEQGRLSEHACTICHAGPEPIRVEAMRSRYRSLDEFKPAISKTRLSYDRGDIPDTVYIDVLSEKYQAAVMPHREIIDALMKHISESDVAIHFHGHEDVVCQGCHHHSPVGQKPPLCENCHGEPFNETDLFKPGLFGAYHRQCLGCHQQMEITKPSDCVGCHAEKPATGS
ncbi:MAG: cytochrome C [candidate division Zixibacteria bacterium]|nr:cytochrome C [candidate division Zixibacteria bacterium]